MSNNPITYKPSNVGFEKRVTEYNFPEQSVLYAHIIGRFKLYSIKNASKRGRDVETIVKTVSRHFANETLDLPRIKAGFDRKVLKSISFKLGYDLQDKPKQLLFGHLMSCHGIYETESRRFVYSDSRAPKLVRSEPKSTSNLSSMPSRSPSISPIPIPSISSFNGFNSGSESSDTLTVSTPPHTDVSTDEGNTSDSSEYSEIDSINILNSADSSSPRSILLTPSPLGSPVSVGNKDTFYGQKSSIGINNFKDNQKFFDTPVSLISKKNVSATTHPRSKVKPLKRVVTLRSLAMACVGFGTYKCITGLITRK